MYYIYVLVYYICIRKQCIYHISLLFSPEDCGCPNAIWNRLVEKKHENDLKKSSYIYMYTHTYTYVHVCGSLPCVFQSPQVQMTNAKFLSSEIGHDIIPLKKLWVKPYCVQVTHVSLTPYFLFRLLRKPLGTFGYELEVWN